MIKCMLEGKDKKILDSVKGCLIGGAAGDALGYEVEFLYADSIFKKFGNDGITEYKLDAGSGKAIISDDTQMTLFTANGLLVADTLACVYKNNDKPRNHVKKAYLDWLYTQSYSFEYSQSDENRKRVSWLCDVPELYDRRAPGNTCLSSLIALKKKDSGIENFISNPQNNSKGCGGVMRVAPVGLNYQCDIEEIDMEGAQIAAITHGNSLGYMPAAVLCHIINRIVYPQNKKITLREIVVEANQTLGKLFSGDKHVGELSTLIEKAIELSENDKCDLENIEALGEGWVGDEALAIAVYCSLKYSNDFSNGIIAAVNHSGDSDSTGAITGNILGALVGYEAIEEKWKKNLECKDIILEISEDIYHGCQFRKQGKYTDNDWLQKYTTMKRKWEK